MLATDRAQKDHLWKIFFFFFLFLHHYSKLNKKGRAMRKGSYWDPPASPHKLVTSLKIVVSRLVSLAVYMTLPATSPEVIYAAS